MLSSPSRMNIHQPIARYIHFYIYRKKIFVRGVVRGIYFEKSLRERLSPERGQNWHDLTLHKCSNTCKSNQNTSLTQFYIKYQFFITLLQINIFPQFFQDLHILGTQRDAHSRIFNIFHYCAIIAQ